MNWTRLPFRTSTPNTSKRIAFGRQVACSLSSENRHCRQGPTMSIHWDLSNSATCFREREPISKAIQALLQRPQTFWARMRRGKLSTMILDRSMPTKMLVIGLQSSGKVIVGKEVRLILSKWCRRLKKIVIDALQCHFSTLLTSLMKLNNMIWNRLLKSRSSQVALNQPMWFLPAKVLPSLNPKLSSRRLNQDR